MMLTSNGVLQPWIVLVNGEMIVIRVIECTVVGESSRDEVRKRWDRRDGMMGV